MMLFVKYERIGSILKCRIRLRLGSQDTDLNAEEDG